MMLEMGRQRLNRYCQFPFDDWLANFIGQAIDLFCGFQVKLEDLITSQDNALLAVNLS